MKLYEADQIFYYQQIYKDFAKLFMNVLTKNGFKFKVDESDTYISVNVFALSCIAEHEVMKMAYDIGNIGSRGRYNTKYFRG